MVIRIKPRRQVITILKMSGNILNRNAVFVYTFDTEYNILDKNQYIT